MASIKERRIAIEKEFHKREKAQKKSTRKLFKKHKNGIPIIKATAKSRIKEIRKGFTKSFKVTFDSMTAEEKDDLIAGLEMSKRFASPEKIREKHKILKKEENHRRKEFKKYMKKQDIKNLNDLIYAERDFNTYLELKEDKRKKNGLIYTDPLMKSVFRIDEKKLERTLKDLYSKSVANAAEAIDQFDKLMYGDNTKIDLSLLREKDDIIASSTKKLQKTLNKTHLDSFRM